MQKYIEVDKNFLYQKYVVEKLRIQDVADLIGHSYSLIRARFKEFNIPANPKRIHSRYDLDEQKFKKCNSPEVAYWIGFIMADGSVCNGNGMYRLEIAINEKDVELLSKFRVFLNTNIPIKYMTRITEFGIGKITRLRICSKAIVGDLAQYGIVPRKTGKEQIRNIPKQYYSDFIRGYFDGDGCIDDKIYHRNGRTHIYKMFRIICANKKFLITLRKILMRECSLSKNKIIKNKDSRGEGAYHLGYCGKVNGKKIFHFLYNNASVYLNRKFLKWEHTTW